MKNVKFYLSALFFLAIGVLCAQQNNPGTLLPRNEKIITGKLENGLTYYICHNEKPENRAIFGLVVNAGSVLEEDSQQGLAHFTEHMGFNGTKHFPGNSLVDELEKKGIVFGSDINASTGCEQTEYFVNLPTDDTVLFDMGLKVLDGWAFGMLLTGDEIDKERGVIIEEWRVYQSGEERLDYKTLPITLKGSKYPDRLPIGTLDNLQNFNYSDLRSFYKKWYRPDNMAIIIVGDFNVKQMEKKVIDYFTMNDKPSTPLVRPEQVIPDNNEPLIAIATDPEATASIVELNYKHPGKKYLTYGDFRESLVESLFSSMLQSRFDEISNQKNCPYQYGYCYSGSYWSRNNDAFQFYFNAKEDKSMTTLSIILTEIQRLKEHHFLATELVRAKEEELSAAEQSANEQDKKDNRILFYNIAFDFLENCTYTSNTFDFELTKELLPTITLEEINALIDKMFEDNNITMALTMPEKKGAKVPTEQDVLNLMKKIAKQKTTPYVDKVSTLPFLCKEPAAGKVVKRSDDPRLGTTTLELSNGAKVIIKSTDFKNDEIRLQAISKGGTSLYPDNLLVNAQYAGSVIGDCGIGNYTPDELDKFKQGKQYYLFSSIGSYSENIYGMSCKKDFETFLQHLYMVFEAPRKDADVFERKIEEWRNSISMRKNSPDIQFQIDFYKATHPTDTRSIIALEKEHLSKMNLDQMYRIYRERFSNAADFTFALVGNIDIETAIPLIEKYIGGISSTGKPENSIDRSSDFAKGIVDKQLYKGIADKTLFGIETEVPFERSEHNYLAISILNNILDIRMTEDIREKLSGTYGAYAGLSYSRLFKPTANLYIDLGCDPNRVDELTTAIWATIDKIMNEGPTEKDFNKAKEQLIREKETSLKENYYWARLIYLYYYNDYNFYTYNEYVDAINALTVDDIKAVAQYLKHDNYVRFTLYPQKMKK